jgi:hypothetical protein
MTSRSGLNKPSRYQTGIGEVPGSFGGSIGDKSRQ